MAAKKQAAANPAPEAPAPKRTTQKASDLFESVLKAIAAAGPEGISLKDLSEQTGVRPRVLHNVTWRLETKEAKIERVGEGRKVVYATVSAKAKPAPRKRAPRKAAAATKTPAKKTRESIRVSVA